MDKRLSISLWGLGAALLMPITIPNLCPQAGAQTVESTSSHNPEPKPKVILEVIATDFDIGREQEYVYLRVSSDRQAECQSIERKNIADEGIVKTLDATLTPEEFSKIQRLIERPEVLNLRAFYRQRIALVLDAFTSWDIKMWHSAKASRTVRVVAFEPDEARLRKRPYPEPLVKLGCTIEEVRGQVIEKSVELDSECKRILR